MSTMNPLDPYGGTTPPIEQLLGNAYNVVRYVASNMDKIEKVSAMVPRAVTGSRSDGTALTNLLNILDEAGLIINQTVE